MNDNNSTDVLPPDNPDENSARPPNEAVPDSESAPPEPAPAEPGLGPTYLDADGWIIWLRPDGRVTTPVPLSNFAARIVRELVEDDGASSRRLYEISVNFNGADTTVRVPVSDFESLNWVHEHLSAKAICYSEHHARLRLPNAIRIISPQPEKQVVYTHLGWRQLEDDSWVFLHSAGALGALGARKDIKVSLTEGLSRFSLPDPPTGDALVAAVRASLQLLSVAPDAVSIPVFASIWLAVLGRSNLSLFMYGPTGSRKTSVAALAQQFFGMTFDAEHLPSGWSSTSNFLEELLFLGKDVLIVVDDFCPQGTLQDTQRQQAAADRVLRSQGNRSGRGRLTRTCELRSARPPRGMLLATGEDFPRGSSLQARTWLVELRSDSVDLEVLTKCQESARTGLFCQVMSGFVQWLAPRYRDAQDSIQGLMGSFRSKLETTKAHPRVRSNAAQILVGIDFFLRFAESIGATTSAESEDLWNRSWSTMVSALQDQADNHATTDPALRFISLLTAGLCSGQCHLRPIGNESPQVCWGWDLSRVSPTPKGRMVGWIRGGDVFLSPDSAWAVAQIVAREQGEPFTVSQGAIRRLLRDRKLLASTSPRGHREHLTIRRVIEGQRHEVLHLLSDSFTKPVDGCSEMSAPSAPIAPPVPDEAAGDVDLMPQDDLQSDGAPFAPGAPSPESVSNENDSDIPENESVPEDEGPDDFLGKWPDKPDDEEDLDDGAPVPADDGSDDLPPAADSDAEIEQ